MARLHSSWTRVGSLATLALCTALAGCAILGDEDDSDETILEQSVMGSPKNPNVTFMRQIVEPAGGRRYIRVMGINGTGEPLCMSVRTTPLYADEYERPPNKVVSAHSRVTLGSYETRDMTRSSRTRYWSPDPDGACRWHKE